MSIFDEDDEQSDFNNWLNSSPTTHNKPVIAPTPKLFTTKEYEDSVPKTTIKVKKPKLDEYGDELEDDGYRNPGGGDGRPYSLDPTTCMATIRLTPTDHKKFLALGGSKWMKQQLKDASLPV